ncbi:MAG: anthranilate synthase component I [Spirochaetales bacterium]|jgi:anthranilate synthase component I|nr:anthranilate synthase component I [Spirochaetales bacterium]
MVEESGVINEVENQSVRHDGIIKVLAGERFTPFMLARKLNAKVILESSSFQKGKERYSILMVHEAFRIVQKDDLIYMRKDGKRFAIKSGSKDILDVLLYFAKQQPPLHQDLPLPAGGVGYLSYEFSRFCDTIRFQMKPDKLDLPDAEFMFGHIYVIFDHYTDIIYLVGLNYKEHEIDLEAALAETAAKLDDLNFNYLAAGERKYAVKARKDEDAKKAFINGVEKVRQEIIKGNLLQGVLSRRLYVDTDLPALDAYKNLRSTNPSPYLFYLDFGDYQLFGSSPEVHVKVKEGVGVIHPLAGTRRRGETPDEDRRLEKELLEDTKERAEHLMLVDLARNDLGRICEPGTVEVDEFMNIERYSHVMHIKSSVKGNLKLEKTGVDAIRATFPAGTVSGAPKIRAIETIDSLELEPRRFYAGLVGYIEPDGTLDTCITIRSALKKNGQLVLQAGAGIVFDSIAEREYEETSEKLRALASSIGLEI